MTKTRNTKHYQGQRHITTSLNPVPRLAKRSHRDNRQALTSNRLRTRYKSCIP